MTLKMVCIDSEKAMASHFFLSIKWNAQVMARTEAAILKHEMKAMCWVWLSVAQKGPGSAQ